MEKLLYQNIVYTNKLQEYENGKDVLRSLVSPELYRILDEYIEVILLFRALIKQLLVYSAIPILVPRMKYIKYDGMRAYVLLSCQELFYTGCELIYVTYVALLTIKLNNFH